MKVRTATLEDAGRLLEIYSYYVTDTAVSFEYEPPSIGEFRERMEKTLSRYPYLVIEEDGIVQGYAYAGVFKQRAAYDRCCEVTVYVDRNARRRGFGRKLYEALEEELGKRGFLNLYACVAVPIGEDEYLTCDSELFHLKTGYEKVGEFHRCGFKFGRWYNMIWMEKMLEKQGVLSDNNS